jgi:MFS family permease
VGALDLLSILVVPFQMIGLIYRPLADRWGRKKFLIINTFGMSLAMLVIFLSGNIFLYFIGACMVQFFIPHDMHVVYIMEFAPEKHRARVYSSIKFVANMGVMLVPFLRRLLMQDSSEWRKVFLIPAIVGLLCSFVALISARETDAFINSRLRYLRMTDEERSALKREKRAEAAQGGVGEALRFAFSHKQIKWLYITSAFVNVGLLLTMQYNVIMNYGYAEHFLKTGQYLTLDEAVNAASVGVVTDALFFFTIGSALAQVLMGFICDGKGRKTAAISMASICVVSLLGFFFGSNLGWSPVIVGLLCGACVGSYYATNDILIMMIGESSPTNLRSSTISSQYFVTAAGVIVSYGVGLPLLTILGNSAAGWISLGLALPGFVVALICLCTKTHDTTGINMDTVTGTEWD